MVGDGHVLVPELMASRNHLFNGVAAVAVARTYRLASDDTDLGDIDFLKASIDVVRGRTDESLDRMLEIARGAAYLVTDSRTMYIGSSVEAIGRPLPGLGVSPAFLIALGVVALGQIVLTRTVAGRLMVAIGTNEEAVRLSGLDPRPVRVANVQVDQVEIAGRGARRLP